MAVSWREEQLFFDSDAYFKALGEAIGSAQQSVDIEMYIFEDDARGRPLLDLLAAAAARGLRVRVLVDGIGSPAWGTRLAALARAGVHSRIYHPAPWPLARSAPADLAVPGQLFKWLARINKRDHRKLCLIDRREAFCGSMNVSAQHAGWRETGLRVRGREVLDLEASYDLIWSRSHNPALPRELHSPVHRTVAQMSERLVATNHTLLLRRRHHRRLLLHIARSRRRVWITNPYFVPGPQLLRALCQAAQRGVDVRLLLPGRNDVPVIGWISRLYYLTLIGSGVRLFEYLPSVLHAKTVIVDNWARVGTSNLNYRSRYHDLEVDLLVTRRDSLAALLRQFRRDLQRAQRISESIARSAPLLQRLGGHLALLFRNWL